MLFGQAGAADDSGVVGPGALCEALWFGKLSVAGFSLHPRVLMLALSGSLMVSRIRLPKR